MDAPILTLPEARFTRRESVLTGRGSSDEEGRHGKTEGTTDRAAAVGWARPTALLPTQAARRRTHDETVSRRDAGTQRNETAEERG